MFGISPPFCFRPACNPSCRASAVAAPAQPAPSTSPPACRPPSPDCIMTHKPHCFDIADNSALMVAPHPDRQGVRRPILLAQHSWGQHTALTNHHHTDDAHWDPGDQTIRPPTRYPPVVHHTYIDTSPSHFPITPPHHTSNYSILLYFTIFLLFLLHFIILSNNI